MYRVGGLGRHTFGGLAIGKDLERGGEAADNRDDSVPSSDMSKRYKVPVAMFGGCIVGGVADC